MEKEIWGLLKGNYMRYTHYKKHQIQKYFNRHKYLKNIYISGILFISALAANPFSCFAQTVSNTSDELFDASGLIEYEDFEDPGVAEFSESTQGYIFIGDSRFVGMDMTVNVEDKENQFLIAECGMGLKWLKDTAEPEAEQIKTAHPEITEWHLIIGLGVNDRYNKDAYKTEIERLAKDNSIYYVSCNPLQILDPEDTDKIIEENIEVDNFNEMLKGISNIDLYIDTNSYMKENGYQTVDELHYTNNTYKEIYNYIETSISLMEILQH